MTDSSSDTGVLTVLAQRLVDQRLPRALGLKEKVERGELLDDADVAFLENVFADAQKVAPIVARNPEFQGLAGRVVKLYQEITAKALENEQAKKR
jgi:hypothetical protein